MIPVQFECEVEEIISFFRKRPPSGRGLLRIGIVCLSIDELVRMLAQLAPQACECVGARVIHAEPEQIRKVLPHASIYTNSRALSKASDIDEIYVSDAAFTLDAKAFEGRVAHRLQVNNAAARPAAQPRDACPSLSGAQA
jgi:hypothetical protein